MHGGRDLLTHVHRLFDRDNARVRSAGHLSLLVSTLRSFCFVKPDDEGVGPARRNVRWACGSCGRGTSGRSHAGGSKRCPTAMTRLKSWLLCTLPSYDIQASLSCVLVASERYAFGNTRSVGTKRV